MSDFHATICGKNHTVVIKSSRSLFEFKRKIKNHGNIDYGYVQIRSFSGLYFPVFGLNTEIYSVNLCIQSEYEKIRTRKNSLFGQFSCSGMFKLQTNNKLFCNLYTLSFVNSLNLSIYLFVYLTVL